MQLPVAYQASQLCVNLAEPESSESPYTEDPATDADVRTGGTNMLASAAGCPLDLAELLLRVFCCFFFFCSFGNSLVELCSAVDWLTLN